MPLAEGQSTTHSGTHRQCSSSGQALPLFTSHVAGNSMLVSLTGPFAATRLRYAVSIVNTFARWRPTIAEAVQH